MMKNKYISNNGMSSQFVEAYTKTNYRIIGKHKHSAIKPCHWLEQKLMTGRENRNCYKAVFGVESHRCLQNTPSLPFCNHQCVFCWRDLNFEGLGKEFNIEADEPNNLIEEMIRHQQNIVKIHLPLKRYLDNYEIMIDILYYMIFNKGKQSIDSLSEKIHISKNKIQRALNLLKNQDFIKPSDNTFQYYQLDEDIMKCIDSREELEMLINRALTSPDDIIRAHSEALNPNHAAISLDGEPMLYPKMSGLVEGFRNRNMTTFIVTNGTLPERLESLDALPSQLYVTLPASNESLYKKTCRPMVKNGWQKIMSTLDLLESLDTRTLIRLTAVKGLNINENLIDEYIKIVEKANPDFFEIKGFTLQAKALLIKDRLRSEQPVKGFFPDFDFLNDIAQKFEERSNFSLIYTNEPSRDFLFAVNWNKNKDLKITTP